MGPTEPGERGPQAPGGGARRLDRAPSDRYTSGSTPSPAPGDADGSSDSRPTALAGPLARALVAAAVGAIALVAIAAILGSTVGLLFISGVLGAGVGLVLARAAIPGGDARPVARRTITWIAIIVALGAVGVADVLTWWYAISEGGTLGLVDYLWTTFGPFVPTEAIVAALAAAWGANAGPVQG